MVEPTRHKAKSHTDWQIRLHDLPGPGLQNTAGQLHWWTGHAERPGKINLTAFATGTSRTDVKNLQSGFCGRPELIAQLAPYVKLCYAVSPIATVNNLNPALRTWWRILDECEDIAPVRTLSDLSEIHNAAFLRGGKKLHKHYNTVMTVIRVARADQGLPPLYWTAPERPEPIKSIVDSRTVRCIYHYLKRCCFEALHRFANDPDYIPTRLDVTNFLALFLLRTGWNLQTALDVDVSLRADGTISCISPHPTSNDHHIVSSRKARAGGREQFALGTNKSQLSCANIITALVNKTKQWRCAVQHDLEVLEGRQRTALDDVAKQGLSVLIKRKKAILKSPWLIPLGGDSNAGVSYLTGQFGSSAGSSYMDALTKKVNNSLPAGERKISRISLSDFRDAYIEAQYARSGYSWLTAMLAAQHNSVESIAVYLRKRQYKAHSEKRFLSVTEKVWGTVGNRNSIDPTILAGQVEGASHIQIARWKEGKDRSRLGMGCANFYNPPKEISPAHVEGTGCRVQRCTLCPYGIVFSDSAQHITRRLEELRYIQETIPLLSWVQSTFPAEMETTEQVLDNTFDSEVVAHWKAHYRALILSGDLVPLTWEGSYG